MNSSRLVLSMVVLLLLPTGVWSQTAKGSRAATTNNDEAEIRALLGRWAKAFEAHDIDGIMSNYAPEMLSSLTILRRRSSTKARRPIGKTMWSSSPSMMAQFMWSTATCGSSAAATLGSSMHWNGSPGS